MAAGTDGGRGWQRTIVQNRRLYELGDHSSALEAHALRGVDRLVVLHQAHPAKVLQRLEQPRLSALLVVDVCADAHLQRVSHGMDEGLLRPQPLPHAVGIDVLIDDRDERPGVKFADMELMGIPHRIVVSERGLKAGTLEYKGRRDADKQDIPLEQALSFLLQASPRNGL